MPPSWVCQSRGADLHWSPTGLQLQPNPEEEKSRDLDSFHCGVTWAQQAVQLKPGQFPWGVRWSSSVNKLPHPKLWPCGCANSWWPKAVCQRRSYNKTVDIMCAPRKTWEHTIRQNNSHHSTKWPPLMLANVWDEGNDQITTNIV